MAIPNLPPMPNPVTGEPRPPAAPVVDSSSANTNNRASSRGKAPRTPEGESPALEWYYPTRAIRVAAGLVCSALGVVVYVLRSGFGWVGNVWLWLLLAAPPLVFLFLGRRGKTAAGADWLATSDKGYVKIYRLTEVTVHVDGIAHMLQLLDDQGGSLRAQISDLEANHKLWDLVYNGILHSVHVGEAETNKRAREYLQLDNPPHLGF